jgi:predicted nucleotidyltransferase component of viral defense system
MGSHFQSVELTFKSIPKETKKAISLIQNESWLSSESWYLAGGTALALQYGHRMSYDLDFFTEYETVDAEKISNHLKKIGNWIITSRDSKTLYGELDLVKCSFIAYPDFVPGNLMISLKHIKMVDVHAVAVMKIMAISQRGKKRDFFDLYWYLKQRNDLSTVLLNVKNYYPNKQHNLHHFLKSLIYFEDAESDPDPIIFFDGTWEQVKKYFETHVSLAAKTILELN